MGLNWPENVMLKLIRNVESCVVELMSKPSARAITLTDQDNQALQISTVAYLIVEELDVPELKDLIDDSEQLHRPEAGRNQEENVRLKKMDLSLIPSLTN